MNKMETFTVIYHTIIQRMEITLTQYYVLFTLYRVPNISQQSMADKINLSRRGIGKVVKSLCDIGLLQKKNRKYTPCPEFIMLIKAIEKGNKVPKGNGNKVPNDREQSSQRNGNKVPNKNGNKVPINIEQSSHNNISSIDKQYSNKIDSIESPEILQKNLDDDFLYKQAFEKFTDWLFSPNQAGQLQMLIEQTAFFPATTKTLVESQREDLVKEILKCFSYYQDREKYLLAQTCKRPSKFYSKVESWLLRSKQFNRKPETGKKYGISQESKSIINRAKDAWGK